VSGDGVQSFLEWLEGMLRDAREEYEAVVADLPEGVLIVGDDVGEVLGQLGRLEQAANDRTTDEQRAITWGDKFLRVSVTYGETVVVFGRIPTEAEYAAEEYVGDEWEVECARRMRADVHERGYRFGWCYSLAVPDGEPGDTHVSTMVRLTDEEFAEAERLRWSPAVLYESAEWFPAKLEQALELA